MPSKTECVPVIVVLPDKLAQIALTLVLFPVSHQPRHIFIIQSFEPLHIHPPRVEIPSKAFDIGHGMADGGKGIGNHGALDESLHECILQNDQIARKTM